MPIVVVLPTPFTPITRMIDGLVDRMCAELEGSVTLVATGGIAKIVIPNCSHKITVSEDLVFEGLAAIYERNRRI